MKKVKLFCPGAGICDFDGVEVDVVDEEVAIKKSKSARDLREDYKKKGLEILAEFSISRVELKKLEKLVECFKSNDNIKRIGCVVYTKKNKGE